MTNKIELQKKRLERFILEFIAWKKTTIKPEDEETYCRLFEIPHDEWVEIDVVRAGYAWGSDLELNMAQIALDEMNAITEPAEVVSQREPQGEPAGGYEFKLPLPAPHKGFVYMRLFKEQLQLLNTELHTNGFITNWGSRVEGFTEWLNRAGWHLQNPSYDMRYVKFLEAEEKLAEIKAALRVLRYDTVDFINSAAYKKLHQFAMENEGD